MRILFWVFLLVIAIGGLHIWYQSEPKTPKEMFEVRCLTCHDLPDLSQFTTRERRGIVMTIIRERGAGKVITPAEAEQIIAYIMALDATNTNKDKVDGDT